MINRISKMAEDERLDFVMKQDFGYYNYLWLSGVPIESIVKVGEEIIQFFTRNFNEIVKIIRSPDIL